MEGEVKLISVGEFFRQSWGLYRERLGVLTKIALLPVILLIALDLGDFLGLPSILVGIIGLVGAIISFLAALALIFAIQENIQFGEAYRLALRRIWSYGWLTILSGFVVLGGFVMLIIPGIIFVIWFAFAIYVFAIEGERGMNAVLRSREYVQGNWWQVFGRYILLVLATLIIIGVINLFASPIALALGATKALGKSIGQTLFSLFLIPFYTAYLYTLYRSLKTLKPELAGQPPQGPRGFFYFSFVLGILGLIALLVVMVLVAAYLLSGGLGPDMFQGALPKDSFYQLELPE